MNYDEYGEIINGEETYKGIAEELKGRRSVLIGWTDQQGTHLDILFTLWALKYGSTQGGLRDDDLFISVMRLGSFGFEIAHDDTDPGYYNEKLGGRLGSTSEPLAELINSVKRNLKRE